MTRGLNVVTFNAVGAMQRDRSRLGNAALTSAARHGALLLGVECDDVDVHNHLDPDLWWWLHSELPDRDGCLIAGKRNRLQLAAHRWLPGAPASPVNAPRWFLRARLVVDGDWFFTAAVQHLPRRDAGGDLAHRVMVERSRGLGADLIAGDVNMPAPAMRRAYPDRKVRGAQVMQFAAGDRLELSGAHRFDLLRGTTDDDHPGVRVRVWPAGRG